MVKNIGSRIDEKIKTGEIKESELMEEGMELLNKMKNMPGMGDMQKMFEKMGIPGLGKGAKINMGAMEAQLNKNMKTAQMKERIRAKAAANALAKAAAQTQSTQSNHPTLSEEELLKIFSTGEKVEKTPRGTKPPPSKKKKGKK
jgi:spore coat protein CotH